VVGPPSTSCRWKRAGCSGIHAASQTPDARRKIFASKIETLAKLHTYDPQGLSGLADFGKPALLARQVDRWTNNTEPPKPQPIPESKARGGCRGPCRRRTHLDRPRRLSPRQHDFPSDEPRCAVLDWELSTLGDPMGRLHVSVDAMAMPVSSTPISSV